jgi:hypothetical protein
VLSPLGGFLALIRATPASSTRRARLPRVVIGLIAAVAGLSRRYLRHWRRIDPGTHLDR